VILRAAGLSIAAISALSAAMLATAPTASASAAFGWTDAPDDGAAWSACSEVVIDYCIEQARYDANNDGALTEDEDVALSEHGAKVSILGSYDGAPRSINWQILGSDGSDGWGLPNAGRMAKMVVRVGDFVPRYTSAYADGIHIGVTESGSSHTLTVEGSSVEGNWKNTDDGWTPGDTGPDNFWGACTALWSCGDSTVFANIHSNRFVGNTQDMAGDGWGDTGRAQFGGMAVASNSQGRSTMVTYVAPVDQADPNDTGHWDFQVGNPHLKQEGSEETAPGRFSAQVPANYLTFIGVSPTESTFLINRSDDPDHPIVATTTSDGSGGLLIQSEDFHFSTPTLAVTAVARPRITSAAMTAGKWHTSYSQSVPSSGTTGTVTFAQTAGSLPGGLSMSSAGLITGTPTAVGSNSFRVRVTDDRGSYSLTATEDMTLQVGAIKPSAARSLAIKSKGAKRTISWAAPSLAGGAAVDYQVKLTFKAPHKKVVVLSNASQPGLTKVITAKAAKYVATVTARNSAGLAPAVTKAFT
jgi:hypothetical protein